MREVVVDFEPERIAAPFLLRCGALLIDYILIIFLPVAAMLLSRYLGNDGVHLTGGSLNDTGWLLAFLIGVADLIILPAATGQSVGKFVTGLRTVRTDGTHAGFLRMALRQTLGYAATLLTLGLGFLLSPIDRLGRSLHDFLFGTVVIYADKKFR